MNNIGQDAGDIYGRRGRLEAQINSTESCLRGDLGARRRKQMQRGYEELVAEYEELLTLIRTHEAHRRLEKRLSKFVPL